MDVEGLLGKASARISSNYFLLPIDGQEVPVYRERVYCYELYHQMRCLWPQESIYQLGGEVDKSGHPLIRENDLDRVKPDLLIHIPGDMHGNHTVIEVKPVTASRNGIAKDLSTLTAFRKYAGYKKAIYLLYGRGDIKSILEIIHLLDAKDHNKKIDLTLIDIWWHSDVGSSASIVSNHITSK